MNKTNITPEGTFVLNTAKYEKTYKILPNGTHVLLDQKADHLKKTREQVIKLCKKYKVKFSDAAPIFDKISVISGNKTKLMKKFKRELESHAKRHNKQANNASTK